MNEIKMTCQLWPYWTNPDEIAKVSNAFCIALHQHSVVAKVKTRKYNNQPYITHPVRLALRASSHPLCKLFWVCAALLHDTVEDTVYDMEEEFCLKHRIQQECGEDVLKLVEELTNENHDKRNTSRRERKQKDLERLSGVSKPAKTLKMFDRIDNLQEMLGAPIDFKRLYVEESKRLLAVVGDGDVHVANQLSTTIESVYSFHKFSARELEQKPYGTVFEHMKRGKCFVEKPGVGGYMKFENEVDALGNKQFTNIEFTESEVFSCLMRETGEEKK